MVDGIRLPIVPVCVVHLIARTALPINRLHVAVCAQFVAMNTRPQRMPTSQTVNFEAVRVSSHGGTRRPSAND